MKMILFDVLNIGKKNIKIKTSVTSLTECIYVYISPKFLNNITFNKLYRTYFAFYLKLFALKDDSYIYVLSDKLKKCNFGEYINKFKNLTYINPSLNKIALNSIKYLSGYIATTHVGIVTNYITKHILVNYIDKFKKVSIYTTDIDFERKYISLISEIEKEYGTTIEIFSKKDKLECDVAVILEDISFIDNVKYNRLYILTENVLDKFSDASKIYNLYVGEIEHSENYLARDLAETMLYIHKLVFAH